MGVFALVLLFTAAAARMANVLGWAVFLGTLGLIIGLGWIINQI